jgi:ligand-binding sensor domain-containing protein
MIGETWTTFAVKQGLTTLSTQAISQDGAGYLWFGTDGGVYRYDGVSITTFTTKDGLVNNDV